MQQPIASRLAWKIASHRFVFVRAGFGTRPKRQRTTEVPVDTQADEDSDSDFDMDAMDEESLSDEEGEVRALPHVRAVRPTAVCCVRSGPM